MVPKSPLWWSPKWAAGDLCHSPRYEAKYPMTDPEKPQIQPGDATPDERVAALGALLVISPSAELIHLATLPDTDEMTRELRLLARIAVGWRQ